MPWDILLFTWHAVVTACAAIFTAVVTCFTQRADRTSVSIRERPSSTRRTRCALCTICILSRAAWGAIRATSGSGELAGRTISTSRTLLTWKLPSLTQRAVNIPSSTRKLASRTWWTLGVVFSLCKCTFSARWAA